MHIPLPRRSRRRGFLASACIAGALATPPPATAAEAFPVKPVKVIVNSVPAGLTDIIARLVAAKMAQSMGQPLVIENRGGAAVIGAGALAKSAPDGYTVGVLGSSLSALPALPGSLQRRRPGDRRHQGRPCGGVFRPDRDHGTAGARRQGTPAGHRRHRALAGISRRADHQ